MRLESDVSSRWRLGVRLRGCLIKEIPSARRMSSHADSMSRANHCPRCVHRWASPGSPSMKLQQLVMCKNLYALRRKRAAEGLTMLAYWKKPVRLWTSSCSVTSISSTLAVQSRRSCILGSVKATTPCLRKIQRPSHSKLCPSWFLSVFTFKPANSKVSTATKSRRAALKGPKVAPSLSSIHCSVKKARSCAISENSEDDPS